MNSLTAPFRANRRWIPVLLAATLSPALLVGTGARSCRADGQDKQDKHGNKKTEPPPPYTGVKHRIAVTSIKDSAAYTLADGEIAPPASFGSGLVEMLTTALMDCGHFQVFERSQLKDVLDEQSLSSSGLTSPETAVKIGKLKGIEYIITGAITEYSNKNGGGGVNVGPFSVGGKGSTSTITIDLRIIDTTTGEVLNVVHAKGSSGSSGTAIGFAQGNVSAFGGGFNKSSLGKAVRESMNNGVKGICDQMEQAQASGLTPAWKGEVLDVDLVGGKPSTVDLEGGSNAGFKVGDELEILVLGKELKNSSGEVLGRKPDTHIARCRVTGVQEKVMSATITEMGSFQADDIKTYIVHRVAGSTPTGSAPTDSSASSAKP